jgi:hypothetical protein
MIQRLSCLTTELPAHTSGHQTFHCMGRHLVLVIVEQTKSAEGLHPVQHFFFYLSEITYRECLAVGVITVQWIET